MLAPICSYLLLGVSPSTEIIVTRVCTALALADFYLSIAVISKQYLDFANLRFFFVKEDAHNQ